MKDLSILHQNALIKLELDKNAKPKNQTLSVKLYRLIELRNGTHIRYEDGGVVREETLKF